MKKLFILLGLLIFTTQNVHAESMSCNAAMKASKPFIVLYTADNCTYCRRFKPIYAELHKTLNQKFNFVTIDVAKRNNNNGACDKIRVTGIPTLYVFNPKNGDRIQMPNRLYSNKNLIENELDKYYASLN